MMIQVKKLKEEKDNKLFKIGIFDSGIGGLTVYKSIKAKCPNAKIIYVADNNNFPYGSKTKKELINISKNIVDYFIKQDVNLIVIACGTATANALKELNEEYINIPILGIIEDVSKYVKEKDFRKVAVMATEATIKANTWEESLKSQNKNIEVFNIACKNLATIAESGNAEKEEGKNEINKITQEINKQNVEAVILGCTHYPLFRKQIEKNTKVDVIEAGDILANIIYNKYLKNENYNDKVQDDEFCITKKEEFNKKLKVILKKDIKVKTIKV